MNGNVTKKFVRCLIFLSCDLAKTVVVGLELR